MKHTGMKDRRPPARRRILKALSALGAGAAAWTPPAVAPLVLSACGGGSSGSAGSSGGVEVSGSAAHVTVSNRSAAPLRYARGDWFVPQNPQYSRMMVTADTEVPQGQTVNVPAAALDPGRQPPVSARLRPQPQRDTEDTVTRCHVDCVIDALDRHKQQDAEFLPFVSDCFRSRCSPLPDLSLIHI